MVNGDLVTFIIMYCVMLNDSFTEDLRTIIFNPSHLSLKKWIFYVFKLPKKITKLSCIEINNTEDDIALQETEENVTLIVSLFHCFTGPKRIL